MEQLGGRRDNISLSDVIFSADSYTNARRLAACPIAAFGSTNSRARGKRRLDLGSGEACPDAILVAFFYMPRSNENCIPGKKKSMKKFVFFFFSIRAFELMRAKVKIVLWDNRWEPVVTVFAIFVFAVESVFPVLVFAILHLRYLTLQDWNRC